MGRVLGIDFGKVRLGVAVSDQSRMLARPLCVLDNRPGLFNTLKEKIKTLLPIDQIILGLPLLMNGKESPMSEEVRKFKLLLEAEMALPVILWDERLTSAQADRALRDAGLKRKQRAEKEDTLAAAMLLQSYLDSPQCTL